MNNMNDEIEKAYEVFSNAPAASASIADIFEAGWKAALANRPIVVETLRLAVQQTERQELRQRLMAYAVDAFSNGLDEPARLYRELANELFGKI